MVFPALPPRIGVFGGTFDPPHLGHLILASEAQDQLSLDRMLWVLTPDPPHKQDWSISSLPDRLDLLRAALVGNDAFEISRVDIDRRGPHYAVDTVCLLRKAYPRALLVYLMGGDSLHDLHTWHEPQKFVELCDEIGVMRRPDDRIDLPAIEQRLPGISNRLRFVDAPLIEVSGRTIRQRAAAGRSFRYYVLPGVYALIRAKSLYIPK